MGRSGFLSLMSAIARGILHGTKGKQFNKLAHAPSSAPGSSTIRTAGGSGSKSQHHSQKAAEKAAKERYLADRTAEAEEFNAQAFEAAL